MHTPTPSWNLMNSEQIQKYLTPEKVQELFKMLNITAETPEAVARQRIAQYVQSNQIVAQMYQQAVQGYVPEPLDVKDQNSKRLATYQARPELPVKGGEYGARLMTGDVSGQMLVVRVASCEGFAQPDMSGVLTLHLRAGPGRASSKSVQHTDTPVFDEVFGLELSRDNAMTRMQIFQLLKYSPLQIVVIVRKIDGSARVFGHAQLDFSDLLLDFKPNQQLQLKAFGSSEEIVGLMNITLELRPDIGYGERLPAAMASQAADKLSMAVVQFRQEQKQLSDQYKYSCAVFQQELQNARPGARQYLALNLLRDDGRVVPAPSLIQPMYSKQLNTAQKSYRFVNLIPDSREDQASPVWERPFTTLARGTAGDEDKALLLCGLFRGLQLPAFVCVGQTSEQTGFVCVIVVFGVKVQIYYKEEIYYFRQQPDGLYALEDYTNNYPESDTLDVFDIARIDCMFNDLDVFANLQSYAQQIRLVDGQLHSISFNLTRPSLWKRLQPDLLQQLQIRQELAPLIAPFNAEVAELCADVLEQKLWQLIAARRSDVGLSTPRSEALSRLLGNALPSYELEQLTGLVVGNEQFQLCVKNYVRDGEYFDAFPLQIAGGLRFHAPSVFREVVQSEAGRRIIEQVGDNLRLGLRVYVEGYAETTCAVWLIVGCCCVPTGQVLKSIK